MNTKVLKAFQTMLKGLVELNKLMADNLTTNLVEPMPDEMLENIESLMGMHNIDIYSIVTEEEIDKYFNADYSDIIECYYNAITRELNK